MTLSSQCLWVEARGRLWLASWWSPGLAVLKAVAVCCGLPLKWPGWSVLVIYPQGAQAVIEQKAPLREEFPVGHDIINPFIPCGGGQTLLETVTAVWEDESFHCGWWRWGEGSRCSCVVRGLEAVSGFSAGGRGTPVACADADMSHREQLDDLSNRSPAQLRHESFWCLQL